MLQPRTESREFNKQEKGLTIRQAAICTVPTVYLSLKGSPAPPKGTLVCAPTTSLSLGGHKTSHTHWREPSSLQAPEISRAGYKANAVIVSRAPGEGRGEQGRVEENMPDPISPSTPLHTALHREEEEQPALAFLTI